MIRQAATSDIPAVVLRAKEFHAYSPHAAFDFDEETCTGVIGRMIDADEAVIFLSDEGICGGVINNLYFSPSSRVATELFWFAPSEGTELRQAFERWAKDQGAQAVQFSALGDGRRAATERLYRMAGYQVIETAFIKHL